MIVKALKPSDVRRDGGTQPRAEIDAEVVAEYVDAIRRAVPLPPPVVFHDGKVYWLADGFHRFAAHEAVDARRPVECEIRKGTQADAVWFACGANQGHGLRRTVADKNRAVEMAIRLRPEVSARSIAEHVGVSHTFVGTVKERLQVATVATLPEVDSQPTRTGRDGKTYPATPKKKTDRKPAAPPGATSEPATESVDAEPAGGEPEREAHEELAPTPEPPPVEAPGVRLMLRRTEFAIRVRAVLDDFGDLSATDRAALLRNEADLIAARSAA